MSREQLYGWFGWLAVTLVLVASGWWIYQRWEVSQPVPFDHKKHVDFGIACDACHVGAKDAVKASVPNTPACALCHQPGKASPKTSKILEEYIQEMKTIPWKKIYRAPQHVRFSHKRHVEMAGLDCKVCHGDIGKMEGPVSRQAVPIQMERCMECHRREKVTTDCMACHR